MKRMKSEKDLDMFAIRPDAKVQRRCDSLDYLFTFFALVAKADLDLAKQEGLGCFHGEILETPNQQDDNISFDALPILSQSE